MNFTGHPKMFPAASMISSQQLPEQQRNSATSSRLQKRINDERDVIHFKTASPAYQNILSYVDLLCERIHGTSNKVLNVKYTLSNQVFRRCEEFLGVLEKKCDETDLKSNQMGISLRFGHGAFRDWFDVMRNLCKEFIDEIAASQDDQLREELLVYLSESFGNRMRIDYGTGHELNFIIFTMGLSILMDESNGDKPASRVVTKDGLRTYIQNHGWDIHALFAHKYLRLCRRVQAKFRLEPAGSRGVYNMDDYQFLPFLFGVAQLSGVKYISTSDFYQHDQVDMYKSDFIFFEAVDFILSNKRGPFNEHSYTLWCFTNHGSWDNIFRRIRLKFTEDIVGPFPIIQHLSFGEYILRWLTPKQVE